MDCKETAPGRFQSFSGRIADRIRYDRLYQVPFGTRREEHSRMLCARVIDGPNQCPLVP